jgi:hypothetical protein
MKFVLVPAGDFLMGSDETPKSPAKGRADRAITPTNRGGEHAIPDPGFLR